MSFRQEYPLSLNELLLAPVILRENVPELAFAPWVSGGGMRDVAEFGGCREGAVRTALSRLRASGEVESFVDSEGVTRYRMSAMSRSISHAVHARSRRPPGFVLAVFSFATEQARERHIVRSTLTQHGFQKLAQNVYINGQMDTSELQEIIRQHGLSDDLFLFQCNEIHDPALRNRLADLFDLPGRTRTLLRFETHLRAFLEDGQPDGDELARRCIYAGPVHYRVTYTEEPPLPASYFPPDYPGPRVTAHLSEFIRQSLPKLIDYYRRINV